MACSTIVDDLETISQLYGLNLPDRTGASAGLLLSCVTRRHNSVRWPKGLIRPELAQRRLSYEASANGNCVLDVECCANRNSVAGAEPWRSGALKWQNHRQTGEPIALAVLPGFAGFSASTPLSRDRNEQALQPAARSARARTVRRRIRVRSPHVVNGEFAASPLRCGLQDEPY